MLCVIAKIDEEAREKLVRLSNKVGEFGITPKQIHGHITLVTYIGENETLFIAQCKNILKRWSTIQVYYEKIEVLKETSIIVVTPHKNVKLLMLHNSLSNFCSSELDGWTVGEHWYPHTTLLYKENVDLETIAYKINEQFIPFNALITEIEFSKVEKNGYTIVDRIQL